MIDYYIDIFDRVETYKYYDICRFGDGYSVFFEGDELYFQTVEDAKSFIDEIS